LKTTDHVRLVLESELAGTRGLILEATTKAEQSAKDAERSAATLAKLIEKKNALENALQPGAIK